MSWNWLALPWRKSRKATHTAARKASRIPVRPSFRPLLETLEDRLAPAVSVPSGFANISIVSSGLASPSALEALPDGRLLVGLQNGTIRVVQNDSLLSQVAITLSNVDSGGERGLVGITYDPNFASNHFIYVYYTANASANPSLPFSHNRLSRLTLSGNTASNEQVLWEFPAIGDAIWHMGGSLHFGSDGKLYVGVGQIQNPALPQSLNNPFGKIHRFDVSGSTATIPTDNPFYNTATGNNRSIWALGLRNPFTAAFQPGTSRFYINDVGESSWEEINPGQAGANFGWPTTEGTFNQSTFPNFTNPIYAYSHSEGFAITGGDFYNPQTAAFPSQYVGKYFFEDFSGFMRTLDPATRQVSSFATGLDFPTDMRVANNGAIYYITRGADTGGQPGTGGIGKIVYSASQLPVITSQPASKTYSVGETATLTVGATGPGTLSYQWQKLQSSTWTSLSNGGRISGATAATLTITSAATTDAGSYRVIVSNSSGSVTSNQATLTITSNQRPTATIVTPQAGTTFRGGSVINYSGTGSDPEEGAITSGSRFTWQVDFHHNTHTHPFIAATTGSTSGSFTIPFEGHPEGTIFYRIFLTVTDSQGLSGTTFRDITPQLVQVTLNTNIAGLQLKLDEQPKATPYTFNGVINTDRTIEAPLTQTVGGITYQFERWADSLSAPALRTIRLPASNITYTANYKVSSSAPATFVSDLPYTAIANGWGPIEKDKSNGEQAAGDGTTITLNGVTYAKGLGTHAASEVSVPLNGQYSTFLSDIGVDDEVGSSGSVIFQVWADGTKLYESPLLTGSSTTVPVSVNVAGRTQLRLIVTGGPDGINFDHADWANARLTSSSTSTVPAAPTNLTATAVSASQINLAWIDNSSNETGFQIRRATDSGFTQNLVTTSVGANVTTHQVTGLTAGTTYYFQVRAVNGAGNSSYSNTANATPQAASSAVFVSDLAYTVVANGFGPVEKDKSNGEDAAGDGNTLTLNGVTYAKGLGTHASSEVTVPLNGQYSTFLASIGVDDEVGSSGSVIFQVLAGDGTVLYQSPLLTGSSATVPISVDVTGRNQLRLIVTGGPDDIDFDHADWANARLTPASASTLAAPTNLTATAASSSQINLAWTDNSTNETGFQIQRATDSGFTQNVVSANVGADVTTYQATGLTAGVTYYFRVRAVNGSTNSSYSNTDSATTTTTTNQPPQVTQAAQVIGTTSKTATLRVAASDDSGAQNLKYTWSVVGTPPAPVTFSPNGTNAASTTTATFSKAGTYTLRVTIADLQGAQTTSQVTHTVSGVLTTITVSPSSANVDVSTTKQFTAAARDQFGTVISAPITWSIDAGGIGTISSTGLYQAPSFTGTATIRATSGSVSGTAIVSVKKRGRDNIG